MSTSIFSSGQAALEPSHFHNTLFCFRFRDERLLRLTTWLWTGLHPSALPCGTRQRHECYHAARNMSRVPPADHVETHDTQSIDYHSKIKLQDCGDFPEQSSLQCLEPNYPLTQTKLLLLTCLTLHQDFI